MPIAPTPQIKFEVAVHEGYQFTAKGHTRIKLLISIAEANRQWVGWYMFAEGLSGAAAKAYDDIAMNYRRTAASAIQFADRAIARTPIRLQHARPVNRFARTGLATQSRIHEARFVPYSNANGCAKLMRLEMAMSFDLATGNDREVVRATVSMRSPERPVGDIHPVAGWMMPLGHQSFAHAQNGPGHDISHAAQCPA